METKFHARDRDDIARAQTGEAHPSSVDFDVSGARLDLDHPPAGMPPELAMDGGHVGAEESNRTFERVTDKSRIEEEETSWISIHDERHDAVWGRDGRGWRR
jgi:hypothetical protein